MHGRIDMQQKSSNETLSGTATRGYQDDPQEPRFLPPRSAGNDAPGDTDAVKRYRRFFQTHDLNGLPARDDTASR
jgi:hypothetical protein